MAKKTNDSYLHRIKFVTKEGRTRIWLDDDEVCGCVGAVIGYEINALPIVKLLIHATEVEVECDVADVEKESIEDVANRIEEEKSDD